MFVKKNFVINGRACSIEISSKEGRKSCDSRGIPYDLLPLFFLNVTSTDCYIPFVTCFITISWTVKYTYIYDLYIITQICEIKKVNFCIFSILNANCIQTVDRYIIKH